MWVFKKDGFLREYAVVIKDYLEVFYGSSKDVCLAGLDLPIISEQHMNSEY